MNEPNEFEFEISVPESVPLEEAVPEAPAQDAPAPEASGSVTYVLPEGYITARAPEPQPGSPVEEPPAEEPPPEEPPIVRHDPFAYMRGAPWMNRKLSPSGRAAALARRELKAFPAIEGRDPNGADLDAIVKRVVDTMVPIFRRERATDIAYDELEKRRAARIAAVTAAAPAARGAAAASSLVRTPMPAAGPLAAAALMVTPTNSQNSTIDLGGGLRGSTGPNERSVRLQRRVSVPLKYGLELTDWKELPVPMMKDRALGGLEVLLVQPGPLVQAIGPEAAAKVLSRPGVIGMAPSSFGLGWTGPLGPLEIRIAESTTENEGKDVSYREVSQEEIEKACPNVPTYQRLGAEAHAASQRETGLSYGPVVGTKTHAKARKAADLIEEELKAMGLVELLTEKGLLEGKRSYQKGYSRLDVLEIYDRETACIIDYKTGGATVDDGQVRRYIRETALYIAARKLGYSRIYFVPIHLP